jgi:hypothetical protein
MANLAYLCEHGLGVAKDSVEACAWYRKAREWYQKAAEAGNAEGSQNLKRLTSIDTSIQSADRLFRALLWVFLLPAATILFVATGRYSGRLPSQFSGPSRVKLALLLLWINLSLTLARLGFASLLDQSPGVGIGCFLGGVGLELHAVLLRFVGKGSNIARVILLLGILPAILFSAFVAQGAVTSLQSTTLMIVGLALSGFAVFLLFSGESGPWFTSRLGDHRHLCATISL